MNPTSGGEQGNLTIYTRPLPTLECHSTLNVSPTWHTKTIGLHPHCIALDINLLQWQPWVVVITPSNCDMSLIRKEEFVRRSSITSLFTSQILILDLRTTDSFLYDIITIWSMGSTRQKRYETLTAESKWREGDNFDGHRFSYLAFLGLGMTAGHDGIL